jgi:molybdopterin synthase catalytic subunit
VKIAIQSADFDVSIELAKLRAAHRNIGAVVSFVGTVREMGATTALSRMELEHYPGMTERSLEKIVQRAMGRWQITDVVVIHRIGMLSVSDQIVLVAVASQHRQTAFNACEFIMDYLKTEAPFWKKEMNDDDGQWVDTREVDLHALRKWKIK